MLFVKWSKMLELLLTQYCHKPLNPGRVQGSVEPHSTPRGSTTGGPALGLVLGCSSHVHQARSLTIR